MKKQAILFSAIAILSQLFFSCPYAHFDERPSIISTIAYIKILGEKPCYYCPEDITIVAPSVTIEESDIEIQFSESDAPTSFVCSESFPIKMQAEERKKITLTIAGNEKYRPDVYDITILCTLKKSLHLKKLTVCGSAAATSKIYVKKEKDVITKDDIDLSFHETDAPKDFKIHFQKKHRSAGPPHSTVYISVKESDSYQSWYHGIGIIEEKSENPNEKTIEDCYLALESQTQWNGAVLTDDINFATTVKGFAGSVVEWKSRNSAVLSNTGKLIKNLKDTRVEVEVHVAWRGEHRYSVFSTTVERIKKIQAIKPTKPLPTKIEFNFEAERFLLIYINDILMKKYFIKSIDLIKKEIALSLLEVRDKNGNMVKVEDLETQQNMLEFLSVILSDKYLKLKKADTISWEELKDYMLDYFKFLNGNEDLPTDDDIFETLTEQGIFGATLEFSDSLVEFKALEKLEQTRLVKNMLESLKATIIKMYFLPKDIADENILSTIKEEEKIKFKQKIEKMRRTKLYSYSLKKNDNLSIWPLGYSFEDEAVYHKKLPWYEQNGIYTLYEADPKIYIVTHHGYRKEDNTFLLTLMYDNSTGTTPAPRYNFTGFLPCTTEKEMSFVLEDFIYQSSIHGKIQDNRDSTLQIQIERFLGTLYYKPLEGNYSLVFSGEIIE